MKPVLFTIPFINWDIPGYGLMMMAGFMLSIWWAARRAAKSGANPDVLLNCGFVALIAGVVGCRTMYVIHYWDQFKYRGGFLDIAWAIIDVRKGGLEFYGGFILSVICVVLWLRLVERVSLRWYFDIIAPSAALGLAIGRVGCFLNGCCFGGVCNLPWHVSFPYGSSAQHAQWREKLPGAELPKELLHTYPNGMTMPLTNDVLKVSPERIAAAQAAEDKIDAQYQAAQTELATASTPADKLALERKLNGLSRKRILAKRQYAEIRANLRTYGISMEQLKALAARHRSLPVHPTQVYSTITALLVAFFLNALYWRRSRDGQVIMALFLIEPVTRWLLEVIRADNPVDTIHMFTISQFLALCMTVVGLVGLLLLRALPARSPRAEIWEPPEESESGPLPAGG